jgi:UDP-3-O-[3-hydroxymyristoyl] glucosamine N-acyltransferase
MKSISIDQITNAQAGLLSLQQKHEIYLKQVLPAEVCNSDSLVFASSSALAALALKRKSQALILTTSVFSEMQNSLPTNINIWTTSNIQAAMSGVLPLFDLNRQYLTSGIHPTASIHPTAQVDAKAHIGAYAVIDAYAVVGADTIIYPHVFIGAYCEIGQRCFISSHVTIGSDGFGFYTDKTFTHHKIPQIGKVVIEDDCEFGAHCAVDRATLTETRIKKGSKFDNFCHIAHNVQFGENALVAAGFIVAGSTQIGKNLMTSGGVHVLGHLNVPDNVILSARAGVAQSIDKPGMYGGFPLEPHKESIKTLVSLPQIKKIRKQVNKILRHLNLNEED